MSLCGGTNPADAARRTRRIYRETDLLPKPHQELVDLRPYNTRTTRWNKEGGRSEVSGVKGWGCRLHFNYTHRIHRLEIQYLDLIVCVCVVSRISATRAHTRTPPDQTAAGGGGQRK